MPTKISLAGNPNSGKTTMFNALTGSSQRVGNWPGVTVEKKEGQLKEHPEVIIQDLPGIYSLSPYTLEEVVTRNYLISEHPDAIINIVDATNIERNLYLTTQLAELGIPLVIALNMIDEVRKKGDSIDLKKLGAALNAPVMESSAVRGDGCRELAEKAIHSAGSNVPALKIFSSDIEKSLSDIEKLLPGDLPTARWYAVKLFEQDLKAVKTLMLPEEKLSAIKAIADAAAEKNGCSTEEIIASERYAFIERILKSCVISTAATASPVSEKIDSFVTNRFLALPIFAAVMFLVYYVSITTVGTMATDWVNDVLFGEWIPQSVTALLEKNGTSPWLVSLIVDGIIAGVGAVLGFLPQMMMLFLFLSFLEDCGYMSRVAFIMDRIFRSFGLSGKSFIPMLIGTGCSVPGIMASRTIENESDRRMTVITTSFIPCGAKLPVIALITGALFDNSAWVSTSAYAGGIAAVMISGIILKKTSMFSGNPSPFIMELPAYHLPLASSVIRTTLQRSWSFVKKAATIILLSTVVVWLLQNFTWKFTMTDRPDASMLAALGDLIAPLFKPLGWGNWRAAVATITGLIAKENVVSTLRVLYSVEELAEQEFQDILGANYSKLQAYSFLMFNLLCAPCFAAVGAIRREMLNAKWTIFALSYLTVFAFAVSLMIYQFGLFFITGDFTVGTAAAAAVLAAALYLLLRKNKYTGKESGNAAELHGENLK